MYPNNYVSCFSQCPENYYGDPGTLKCESKINNIFCASYKIKTIGCLSNCKKCQDNTFCTECITGYYLYQEITSSQCVGTCPTKFFPNTIGGINICSGKFKMQVKNIRKIK